MRPPRSLDPQAIIRLSRDLDSSRRAFIERCWKLNQMLRTPERFISANRFILDPKEQSSEQLLPRLALEFVSGLGISPLRAGDGGEQDAL